MVDGQLSWDPNAHASLDFDLSKVTAFKSFLAALDNPSTLDTFMKSDNYASLKDTPGNKGIWQLCQALRDPDISAKMEATRVAASNIVAKRYQVADDLDQDLLPTFRDAAEDLCNHWKNHYEAAWTLLSQFAVYQQGIGLSDDSTYKESHLTAGPHKDDKGNATVGENFVYANSFVVSNAVIAAESVALTSVVVSAFVF